MTTEDINADLKEAWMGDATAASLFGFPVGADFDAVYSKVSVVRLLLWVVASVVARKETLLSEWKEEVRSVADATHYGTEGWWKEAAKGWQKGYALSVVDGKMAYGSEVPGARVVTAAAVTTQGRTLLLRVAKGTAGNYRALEAEELEELANYLRRIKPMGINVSATSGSANKVTMHGVIRYRGELDGGAVKAAVRAAATAYGSDLEFGSELYVGALTAAMMGVEGVVDVHVDKTIIDDRTVTDHAELSAGYASVDVTGMAMEAL